MNYNVSFLAPKHVTVLFITTIWGGGKIKYCNTNGMKMRDYGFLGFPKTKYCNKDCSISSTFQNFRFSQSVEAYKVVDIEHLSV
jgi:hypothetical protein